MALNPPGQYTDDRNLAARQRLWGCQVPVFDVAAWVLEVTCVRPARAGPVVIEDAQVAADYVTSLASHYQPEVARAWHEVAADVHEQVQAVIDAEGQFRTAGDVAAFVCR